MLSVMPSALVILWLVADGTGLLAASLHGTVAVIPIPPLILTAAIGLFAASIRASHAGLRRAALLLPCAAAPAALLYPWGATPGPPLGGFGELPYFLSWLFRYPNLGPFNYEVLAGIAAMLAAGFLPALVAVLAQMRAPRPALRTVAVLALIAYLPVLIRLDLVLTVVGWRLFEEFGVQPYPFYGPATRAIAVAAALGLAFGRSATTEDVSRPPPGSPRARR